MNTTSESRSERIDIRATPSAKQLLQQAARATNKTVSEFLLDSALSAASETLADQRLFILDDEQWEQFTTELDRGPTVSKPRLKKLLEEPGVFD